MSDPGPLTLQELGDAERIALAYARAADRPAWLGVLALDAQLARVALSTREPALAQLKLAWWRDAIAGLAARRGSHPVLELLAQVWPGRGQLSGMIDAWEELAVSDGDLPSTAGRLAEARASAFAAAAGAEANAASGAAARRWTMVGLADHAPSAEERLVMLAAARDIGPVHLTRALRPLAVLDGLAKRALRRGGGALLGDRLSPLAAIRLGIFGR